jgi:hypothetical protein
MVWSQVESAPKLTDTIISLLRAFPAAEISILPIEQTNHLNPSTAVSLQYRHLLVIQYRSYLTLQGYAVAIGNNHTFKISFNHQ